MPEQIVTHTRDIREMVIAPGRTIDLSMKIDLSEIDQKNEPSV